MANRKNERMEERGVTERHYCHFMTLLQVKTSMSSEFINQNGITVPLPDADEDFTKEKTKKLKKKAGKKLETSQVS